MILNSVQDYFQIFENKREFIFEMLWRNQKGGGPSTDFLYLYMWYNFLYTKYNLPTKGVQLTTLRSNIPLPLDLYTLIELTCPLPDRANRYIELFLSFLFYILPFYIVFSLIYRTNDHLCQPVVNQHLHNS